MDANKGLAKLLQVLILGSQLLTLFSLITFFMKEKVAQENNLYVPWFFTTHVLSGAVERLGFIYSKLPDTSYLKIIIGFLWVDYQKFPHKRDIGRIIMFLFSTLFNPVTYVGIATIIYYFIGISSFTTRYIWRKLMFISAQVYLYMIVHTLICDRQSSWNVLEYLDKSDSPFIGVVKFPLEVFCLISWFVRNFLIFLCVQKERGGILCKLAKKTISTANSLLKEPIGIAIVGAISPYALGAVPAAKQAANLVKCKDKNGEYPAANIATIMIILTYLNR